MAKFRLTFLKDHGCFDAKMHKGDTLTLELSSPTAINYDKIKEAALKQYGRKIGPVSSDYYTLEKI